MTCSSRTSACALAALALWGQATERSAALEGSIRDARGRSVVAAVVQLKTNNQTLTARSDSSGIYRFPALPADTYTLRVEIGGKGEASFGPFFLAQKEERKIDLTLAPAKPEFFDEPTFIVAGVADNTGRGGHGSDAILRSSEALAKATASLSKDSAANSMASEKSLRQALEREPGNAELHHSLADIDEQFGNPLEAAHEYQRAAELDASERNLFDWAAELLAHRAAAPAVEVFTTGNRRFPRSTRMLLGLAVAHYARGSYDQAAQRFFDAADLNPSDPGPYLFLAKVQSSAIAESNGFVERMGRFARLQPENAWANFYCAASLWKQKGASDAESAAQVLALLQKALRLDPNLAAAHLQLGIVYAGRKEFPKAISAYRKAIEIDPRMEEAHYRLAQAYAQTGDKPKAQEEFEIHHQLTEESSQQVERERREVQQFVVELRGRASERHQ
jgi:tetratricopeptide (TPR) repeat protein